MIWAPQSGPQHLLVKCPLTEILFGGARGGGKTDGILGKYAIKADLYGRNFNAVFFRKEMPQQDDLVERAKELYKPLGAEWFEFKRQFVFPAGGRVRFRPLEDVEDAEKYQGQNLTDAAVEEAGNYAEPNPIDRLFGCLRSTAGVPVQLILTANPGGPGHQWIKQRYISPCPMGLKILRRRLPNGAEHLFTYIPSRLQHNQILLERDPEYVNRLYLVGSDALVRAWLRGDWDVVEGAFFDRWNSRMILRPFTIPAHWPRSRSLDWGYAKPFSVGWWALAEEDHEAAAAEERVLIPKGSLVRYREWYGVRERPDGTIEPNVGVRLDAEEVAKGIIERERDDPRILYGVADPSMWGTVSGPSPAERMATYRHPRIAHESLLWRKADNKRVVEKGHLGGWDQMRARMRGIEMESGGFMPLVFCFSTCAHSIRTIPVLQHDKNRAEDVDSETEDHCADEWRYECMSRPLSQIQPQKPKPLHPHHVVNIFGDVEKPRSRYRG
jgi:hypothetical protein